MLSYREHLTKTEGKLKNRNNLLMKLAGSTWGTSANTLWPSAVALCYSAAEYCAPVWSCSAHTSHVDVQLNSTMRLISGTLRSTPLPWLLCSPTLNRQPYKGRLPLTRWWRKSLNMTVGQCSLISLTHHCHDWHPLWLDLQPVDNKSRWRHNWNSAQVVNSHLVCDVTPQSGKQNSMVMEITWHKLQIMKRWRTATILKIVKTSSRKIKQIWWNLEPDDLTTLAWPK